MRDQRSGLVREIIALRERGAPGSSRLSVCQLCGELAATGGWGGALVRRAAGEFVSTSHDHGAIGDLRALLRASPRRWCEWCQAPIRIDASCAGDEPHSGGLRICAGCRAAGRVLLIGRESQARHLRTLSDWQLRAQHDRAERHVALEGTARSRELAAMGLALHRARRRLPRDRRGPLNASGSMAGESGHDKPASSARPTGHSGRWVPRASRRFPASGSVSVNAVSRTSSSPTTSPAPRRRGSEQRRRSAAPASRDTQSGLNESAAVRGADERLRTVSVTPSSVEGLASMKHFRRQISAAAMSPPSCAPR